MARLPRGRKFGSSSSSGDGGGLFSLSSGQIAFLVFIALSAGWNYLFDRPPDTSGTAGWVDVGDEREWTFDEVSLTFEDGWWFLDARAVAGGSCIPGFGGSAFLYGRATSSVREPDQMHGKRLKLDTSWGLEEHHFCLPGYEGLLMARDGTVAEVTEVEGDLVTVALSGRFDQYDAHGSRASIPVTVNADFVARVDL